MGKDEQMIESEFYELIERGKAHLDAAYDHYFEYSDGTCKSSEGSVTIFSGTYFDRRGGQEDMLIEVYSYVFARGRREVFKSAAEFEKWALRIKQRELACKYDEYGNVIEETGS